MSPSLRRHQRRPVDAGDRFPSQPLDAPLLEVEDVKTSFRTERGLVRAVAGVSFSLERGKTLGGVGESGTGARHGGTQANLDAFTEVQWVTMRSDLPSYPF